MSNIKQRVFIYARKRNIPIERVYNALEMVGALPTYRQVPPKVVGQRIVQVGFDLQAEIIINIYDLPQRDCTVQQAKSVVNILRKL